MLFIVYRKFKFNYMSCILSVNAGQEGIWVSSMDFEEVLDGDINLEIIIYRDGI